MDLSKQISQGAFSKIIIIGDESVYKLKFPSLTLQVLKSRVMQENGKNNKLRFTVSDGQSIVHGIWNVPPERQDDDHLELEIGTIVKVTDYEVHQMAKNKPVIVIREWSKLGKVPERIGNPQALSNTKTSTGAATGSATSNASKASGSRATASGANTTISPIESLSPYQNKWTIRARVSNKSDVRTFHNARGEGKLFNVVFLDESGEIKATGFGEQVDAFYDQLQEGQVYYVTRCRVTLAKRQLSNVQNEYELIFERDTQITLCNETAEDVPAAKFNFTDLNAMKNFENGSIIDFIGVLKEVHDVQQITSKTSGRPYDKRDLVLVDQSNNSVRVTIWGKSANEFDAPVESVVALKGAKINDFNGRNISVLNSTTLTIDPDIAEAHSLKGWYDGQGKHETFTALQGENNAVQGNEQQRDTSRLTLQQVIANQLGNSSNADYFNTKATLTFIKRTGLTYPACTTAGCGKKVIQETNGHWRCMKCDITMEVPNYRYIMTFSISDHTTQLWVSCFDDVGTLVLGRPACEVTALIDANDSVGLDEVLNAPVGKEYIFRCRARQDSYNDQVGIRYSVLTATPVDFATEAGNLIKELSLY